MTYGGKTRSNSVIIFANNSAATDATYTIDSIKGDSYSMSFSHTKKITTLFNSIVIPQGAIEKVSASLTRMSLTNCVTTSLGLMSSQNHEPANAITAAAIWTKGGISDVLASGGTWTSQAQYLTFSVLIGRD